MVTLSMRNVHGLFPKFSAQSTIVCVIDKMSRTMLQRNGAIHTGGEKRPQALIQSILLLYYATEGK